MRTLNVYLFHELPITAQTTARRTLAREIVDCVNRADSTPGKSYESVANDVQFTLETFEVAYFTQDGRRLPLPEGVFQ